MFYTEESYVNIETFINVMMIEVEYLAKFLKFLQ